MPTLGTQNISTSYPQLLKTFGLGGVDGNLQVITDGDNTSSALSLSTTGVQSTGSLAVDGTSLLTGIVTFGTSLTASTGTATIGTLSVGTATLGTATISTATISSATIPRINGATTFATGFTSSTGTNTLGTIASTTISNTGLATVGTLEIGASGPNIANVNSGSTTIGAVTLGTMTTASSTSTGTFALAGVVAGDIVIGQTHIAFTGSHPMSSFSVAANDVCRYTLFNPTTTISTITSGTISALSLRTTA